MPELLEAEMYRQALAPVRGGQVVEVHTPDHLVAPEPHALVAALTGVVIDGIERQGKVVVLVTDRGRVALRFGMTGRLIVGHDDPVPQLAYGWVSDAAGYDRWRMRVDVGTDVLLVRLSDPRRLARVLVDPDLSHLGPDAWSVSPPVLAERLRRRRGPIKAALMDQKVVAGLGNLLVDEALWRAGIDPSRPAHRLSPLECTRLGEVIPVMLNELMQRGGSHRGDLSVEFRTPGARCPVDGVELVRRSIGGRTSWSCPHHQR